VGSQGATLECHSLAGGYGSLAVQYRNKFELRLYWKDQYLPSAYLFKHYIQQELCGAGVFKCYIEIDLILLALGQ
jgi:hypothetical protein